MMVLTIIAIIPAVLYVYHIVEDFRDRKEDEGLRYACSRAILDIAVPVVIGYFLCSQLPGLPLGIAVPMAVLITLLLELAITDVPRLIYWGACLIGYVFDCVVYYCRKSK